MTISATPEHWTLNWDHYNGQFLVVDGRHIRTHGAVTTVEGTRGRAVYLNGREQFIDLGQNFTCHGNLDNCQYGATVRFTVRPSELQNGMYFVDSFPVKVYYQDGRLYAVMQTADRKWEVSSLEFNRDKWQVVEVSWHPTYGLTLYLNGERVGYQTVPTYRAPVQNADWRTYFGRPLVTGENTRYANTIVEDIGWWDTRWEHVPKIDYPDVVYPIYPPRGTNRTGSVGGGKELSMNIFDGILNFIFKMFSYFL